MFYTLFVLLFGVYIGQEYPQIPSVKSTLNILMENLNKVSDDEQNVEQPTNTNSDTNNNLGNENVRMRYGPIRRPYYSLPFWVSNLWSSSLNSSESSTTSNSDHEKTE